MNFFFLIISILHHFFLQSFTVINKLGKSLAKELLELDGIFFKKVVLVINPVLSEDNNCVCTHPEILLKVITFLQLLNSATTFKG